jgi:hypothetical protein
MWSAKEYRQLSWQYKEQANQPGISLRMASVLNNISHSFAGLASQFEVLEGVASEERKQTK